MFVPGNRHSHTRAVDDVRSPPLQLFQQQQQQQRILRSLPERKLIFSLRFLHFKLAITFKNMSAFFLTAIIIDFVLIAPFLTFVGIWSLAAWNKKTILNYV